MDLSEDTGWDPGDVDHRRPVTRPQENDTLAWAAEDSLLAVFWGLNPQNFPPDTTGLMQVERTNLQAARDLKDS